ncbi:hypothetical protein [Treponema zioleckii]|uniref:hypothetical protein n=1 Tax=Treponema zioleckii TaxID=331680 RepID=UPI00168BEDDC|nr:hypothetical protein [Treponema zioleckii]
MKKSLTILFSMISALMFVSCFEMKQQISYKKGIYNYSIEFTVDKTVLAMLGENTSIDSEEILGSVDSEDFTVSPEKIRIEKVNTQTHEGSRFLFSIDEKTTDTLAQIFLPSKKRKIN